MKSYAIVLFFILQTVSVRAEAPDENLIFYHIHQATRWAELLYSNNCFLSHQGMERHLGKIKYTQLRLVDSKFYEDYIFLRDLTFGFQESDRIEIEVFRMRVHEKAKKLGITHPTNWQNEFVACSQSL